MRRSSYITLMSLLLPALLFSQKISISDFLRTARKDPKYQNARELSTYVSGLNYALPLLQKLEFRAGADETSLSQGQYGIGLGFNSLVQRKEQFKFQSTQATVFDKEADVAFLNALQERYLLISQFYYLQELSDAQTKLNELYEQKKFILRSMLERGLDIKIKDIILNEADQYDLEKNLAQNNLLYKQGLQKAKILSGITLTEIDTSDFIQINTIASFLENNSDLNPASPNSSWRDAQIALAQNEYRLQKADENQLVSNFQLGVQENSTSTAWQNPYFRLAVKIPVIPYNRYKYNALFLDIKDLQLRKQLEEEKLKNNISLSSESILLMINDYERQRKAFDNSMSGQILSNPKLMAEITAIEKIDIQIINQKRVIDLVKTANIVRSEYLNLILLSGKASAYPLKNYLRNDLQEWK